MDRQQVLHQFMQLYALQPERLSKQVRIEQALRQAITQQWPSGLRLPSHRVLADAIQVARQTLALAIGTLLEEQLLTTAHGQGTWTCKPATPPPHLEQCHANETATWHNCQTSFAKRRRR